MCRGCFKTGTEEICRLAGKSPGLAGETKAAMGSLEENQVSDRSLLVSSLPRMGMSQTGARRDQDAKSCWGDKKAVSDSW